ncbi:hypothetical protein BJ508DRAFT_412710 [Ascobolus immersus RN42]|uniref:Uncharacterized protein n=1 Tax=Ascobolus immersus RN42 TaxID=1160509 RepID=A0A3N4IJH0_ASCIM|nr:hypothetical protein BJ508DRAFT_412710 [Ascobolus immersus RN42]
MDTLEDGPHRQHPHLHFHNIHQQQYIPPSSPTYRPSVSSDPTSEPMAAATLPSSYNSFLSDEHTAQIRATSQIDPSLVNNHHQNHNTYSQTPEPQHHQQINQFSSPYPATTWADTLPYSASFAPSPAYGLDMSFDESLNYLPMEYPAFETQYAPHHQHMPVTTGIHTSIPPVISSTNVGSLPFSDPGSQYMYAQADLANSMSFPMSIPPTTSPLAAVPILEPLPLPPPGQQGMSITVQTRTHIMIHQHPQHSQQYDRGRIQSSELDSPQPVMATLSKPQPKPQKRRSTGTGSKKIKIEPYTSADLLAGNSEGMDATGSGLPPRPKSKSGTPERKDVVANAPKSTDDESRAGKIVEVDEVEGDVKDENAAAGRADHRDSGSPEKETTRKRRKIFDEVERQKVKQVRQMRACIRCRLNKRSCSTDDCCKHCQSLIRRIKGSPDLGQYICFRHNLFDMRFDTGIPNLHQQHHVLTQIEASIQQIEPHVRSVIDVVADFISSGHFSTDGMTILADLTRSDDVRTQFAPTLGTELGAAAFEEDGIVPAPVYMQNWFRTIRRIVGGQRRRRKVGEPWSVAQLFELIHKMEYIEHYYQEDSSSNTAQQPTVTARLESDLVSALLSYASIFLAVKYRIFNPLIQSGPGGHARILLYINCIDLIESILMKATDTLLNRVGQKFMNKDRLEDVLSCLEIWEIRYNFGYLWRRSQLSREDVGGCEYAKRFRGMEVGISGVRTALMQRGRL